MTDIWQMSAMGLLDGFADGSLSPVDAMKAVLDRVDAVNPIVNAIFELRAEEAMAAARASEVRWLAKAPSGALDGLPVTVKDSIALAGWPYWRGTRGRIGTTSKDDAPPAARLKEAGAIIFGKTTMPDYGLLPSGLSSAHGTTRNPWNFSMNTGGSSSGAAAAVASGMGPASIGSDLAGSVRLPAAHCGIFGMKPSGGVVPHSPPSSTRVAGPLTRTVADAVLMLSVLSKPDKETGASGGSLPGVIPAADVQGMRIGLLIGKGFGDEVEAGVANPILRAADLLRDAGAVVIEASDPVKTDLRGHLETVFAVKAAMERDELPRSARSETLEYISSVCDAGDAVSAKRYVEAMEGIERAKAVYRDSLSGFDLVISPVMPVTGFPAEALGARQDSPLHHLSYTALTNQLGWPAASIFCGFAPDGLPVGLQITGKNGKDVDVLALAAWYERARGFEAGFPYPMNDLGDKLNVKLISNS
ncbi:amidase [Corticibacterium sp. UT-5YL-CI-8]|nr:amidase [Tianweitania sp. UT-5YL-CI-8]